MLPLSPYRRAVLQVAAASLLVPAVGIVTAPILAHSLGAAGRGEAGIAMAPNLLIVGGATLGLPQALTYVVAKHPSLARSALIRAGAVGILLAVAVATVMTAFSDRIAVGDEQLSSYVVLGIWLALPAIAVGLLRGVALGQQKYALAAADKTVSSALKLVLVVVCAATGTLTVFSVFLIFALSPVASGLVYLGVVTDPTEDGSNDGMPKSQINSTLIRFGLQEWLGSVSTMLMARLGQLLVGPLSSVTQLGLLLIAVTISDLPFLVTQAIRDVVFGRNSRLEDRDSVLLTSSGLTMVTAAFALVIGASLPLWIGIVFGSEFEQAVIASWLLLAAAIASVPGLIAGAALDARGRPARRSIALGCALVLNVLLILILVPTYGAAGAAASTLLSCLTSSVIIVFMASRALKVAPRRFVLADFRTLAKLVRSRSRFQHLKANTTEERQS